MGDLKYIFGIWTAVSPNFGVKSKQRMFYCRYLKQILLGTFMFVGLSSFIVKSSQNCHKILPWGL